MATTKRVSKEIKNEKDIKYLIGLTEDDITMSLIMELFGDFKNHQWFNPYDIITVQLVDMVESFLMVVKNEIRKLSPLL